MPTKLTSLSEAIAFSRCSGYLFAVYKRKDDNYEKISDAFTGEIETDTLIEVKRIGSGTDFQSFTTEDKEYYFLLHNNFNIPNVIPIIKKELYV